MMRKSLWPLAMVVGVSLGGAGAARAHDFTLSRIVDAPVEDVFAAWGDAERVRKWWGPAGFTAPVAEIDLTEGGTSLVCMQMPGGPLMCNTWTYTEIVPNERIAFESGWADQTGAPIDPAAIGIPPGIPDIVPHVVTFTALEDGRTELTIQEFGYDSNEAVELSRMGQEQVLDKFAALFD